MIILAVVVALAGWAFAIAVNIIDARERTELRTSHEAALQRKDEIILGLITQVQLNAQGLQHYPQLGPIEAPPERHVLTDETGLIEVEYDPDDDRDFVEATAL